MPLVDEVIVKSCGNDAHLIGLDNGRKIIMKAIKPNFDN